MFILKIKKISPACLFILLPFYSVPLCAKEPSEHNQQTPTLAWNFTIQRTTPEITQEWLQLIADYASTAKTLFPQDMYKEIQDIYNQLETLQQERALKITLSLPNTNNNEIKNFQPFIGQQLATFIEQTSTCTDEIEGWFGINLNYPNLSEATELSWTLELSLGKNYPHESFNKLKDGLIALTDELNNATVTPNSARYGTLLHGVVDRAHINAAYRCKATLTIQS
jgi:hypothetical protein